MIHERKNDKLDFIKIKNVCFEKGTVKRMKTQDIDWEKMLVKHIYDKEFVSKIF